MVGRSETEIIKHIINNSKTKTIMETYKMQIELTEEEFNAVHGVLLASVMVCVKHDDLEIAGLLSEIGLKLHAAKEEQD